MTNPDQINPTPPSQSNTQERVPEEPYQPVTAPDNLSGVYSWWIGLRMADVRNDINPSFIDKDRGLTLPFSAWVSGNDADVERGQRVTCLIGARTEEEALKRVYKVWPANKVSLRFAIRHHFTWRPDLNKMYEDNGANDKLDSPE